MTIQVAQQPVLKAVQSVLRAAFVRPLRHRDKLSKTPPRAELLRQQMLDTGDLLIDALGLEQDAGQNSDLESWRSYRTMVDAIAQDYASAVAAWRETIEEDLLPARLRLSSVD